MTDTKERYRTILDKIASAANSAKRSPQSIELVAVSKTFEPHEIEPILMAGHRIFGENRVQEAQQKWPNLKQTYPNVSLHLIGPLQTNKIRDAVSLFDVIETLDRDKLAQGLAQEMQTQNKTIPVYIQVNIGKEPQKAGISPEEAVDFVKRCQTTYHLAVEGLMCIPPQDQNPTPYFIQIAELAKTAGLAKTSMGMSHDFEEAISCGATSVRIGSALFGAR